jgi:hypothetical protein
MIKKVKTCVAGIALLLSVLIACPAGANPLQNMQADDKTIFLLQVDPAKNQLADKKGVFTPLVRGAKVVDDQYFGKCLDFGDAGNGNIRVADGGKIKFDGGFTAEAWLYLKENQTPHPGGKFMIKFGSFYILLRDNKLCNEWIKFPTDEIFTTDNKQLKYYPADTEGFGGAVTIPANRWVHLAISYDQDLKVIRTWVDGGLDRTRYLYREGDQPVLIDPSKSIDFLTGVKNIRVGAIRLSKGARNIGEAPAMEAYFHQLQWQGKIAVGIDHIDKSLPLPIEAAITMENPAGPASVVKRVTLDSYNRKVILVDAPAWKRAHFTMILRVYSGNKQVFSKTARIASVAPSGRVRIGADNSISVSGKKIFPLVLYGVLAEDLAQAADMGFNIVFGKPSALRWKSFQSKLIADYSDLQEYLDEAQKKGVYVMMGANTTFGHLGHVPVLRDHPALISWAGFDEPWGTFAKIVDSYNATKILSPNVPIYVVQNNMTRFAETAEGSDIVACDPYPIPLVSLRTVSYHTEALVNAVDGLKPVWTILDQYQWKRPNLAEMRCMMYLALISGANGIGIYSWDERQYGKPGWITKEHPEDLEVLKKSVAELKSLEEILIIPNSARKLTWAPANKALHAAVKEAGGKAYLFVANDSRKAESGTLTIDGIADAAGICLADGANKEGISVKGGKVSFKLAPLAAAVYEIKGGRQ